MRVPLSWLKEFVEIDRPIEELAELLTCAGLEVEAIEDANPGFSDVVVAEVLEASQHPDADKLKLAKVSDGTDTYDLVCGAANCRAGIKVALAKVGAKLPDGKGGEFKIKKSKIRGVPSHGMLCAWDELGLGERADGIAELGDEYSLGEDLAARYGDTVLDIALTPNLGHCFGVYGIAREVAALLGKQAHCPDVVLPATHKPAVTESATVTVNDGNKCPRYSCRMVREIQVGASPGWLVERLELAGMRSVNNIVDITNYVMLETGHPLHAFDLAQLAQGRIEVKCAEEGSTFISLDDIERQMTADDLMICDGERAVAIAGVMGGKNSEVSDATVDVLIEAAYFDPSAVRRTSSRLGLSTESSKRFERGCDPNNVVHALDRAAAMMVELAGGQLAEGVVDVRESNFAQKMVHLRLTRLNKLLGTQLVAGEVEAILKSLQMAPSWDGQDTFTVEVPTYRHDVAIEEDLIEEVARLYGYDNIPAGTALYHSAALPHASRHLFERQVRERLVAEGLQEFIASDLIGQQMAELVPGSLGPDGQLATVLNPVSSEQSVLRPSLMPGLLEVLKFNRDRGHHNIAAFEIGRVYAQRAGSYDEQLVVAIVLTGHRHPYHWNANNGMADFFDLKGVIENLCRSLNIPVPSFVSSDLESFHPHRQAAINSGSMTFGVAGEVHPALVRELDLGQKVYVAEINLQDLFDQVQPQTVMASLPQFPGTFRDWTIALADSVPAATVVDAICQQKSKTLEEVTIRDEYRDEKMEAGTRNVTYRLVYRSKTKTLSQEAVDREHERLVTVAAERLTP